MGPRHRRLRPLRSTHTTHGSSKLSTGTDSQISENAKEVAGEAVDLVENAGEDLWGSISEFSSKELFTIGESVITPSHVLSGLVVVLITLVLAKFFEGRVVRVLSRSDPEREGSARASARLVYYLLLIIGLMVAVQAVGIEPTALFAAGAIFAVGLGLGLQHVVQNFISGILLLSERVIKPGDVLDLDGRMVRVEKMGLRSTVARTLDENQVIVPNEHLAQNKVVNYTLSDQLYRLRVPVGVVYSSDLPTVFEVLERAGNSQSRIKKRPSKVLLLGFGDSSIDFEVSIWITDPWTLRQRTSDLAFAIWKDLKEAGIVIAFPQLDVHVDRDLLEALVQREGDDERGPPA